MELSKENQEWLEQNLLKIKMESGAVGVLFGRTAVKEKLLQDQQKIEGLEKFKSGIKELYLKHVDSDSCHPDGLQDDITELLNALGYAFSEDNKQ